MKTVQDYLNDPRIVNDPELRGDTELIREVHAIRLKLQDETADLTPDQMREYRRMEREKIDADCARLGFKLNYVDLSGQGKLQPKEREVVGK
ncbi:hypothetical protein FACS1894137_17890 [Spirochaetia bacterium]|nr:hypothetical protein FACS1894137_17890 [Spirochaetia bacterium]